MVEPSILDVGSRWWKTIDRPLHSSICFRVHRNEMFLKSFRYRYGSIWRMKSSSNKAQQVRWSLLITYIRNWLALPVDCILLQIICSSHYFLGNRISWHVVLYRVWRQWQKESEAVPLVHIRAGGAWPGPYRLPSFFHRCRSASKHGNIQLVTRMTSSVPGTRPLKFIGMISTLQSAALAKADEVMSFVDKKVLVVTVLVFCLLVGFGNLISGLIVLRSLGEGRAK